ncbi:hypothetical protein OAJ89_01005 [Alphaproteobacteria bacterium]|nr:hypothetical protein [Alphaproteobacteria bacterium]
MYKPISKLFISFIFIFIISCAPVNNSTNSSLIKEYPSIVEEKKEKEKLPRKNINEKETIKIQQNIIFNEMEILLPEFLDENISRNLINSFELSIYKKEIKNIKLNINKYYNLRELEKLLQEKATSGKVFIGTFDPESTKLIKKYCNKGILLFSFTVDKNLSGECVFLINFFPRDDLESIFNYFPDGSKIALLYPENFYGFHINKIIDEVASKSKSIIVARASYKEDLSDAREAIKQLGKYDLRKRELERQKEILKNKNDEISKNALKKIEKFETAGNVDFTHLILPDYSIRLLEIAPLLPFYDIDPQKVQFVGTGVWDDRAFFTEPSLQGAIFSGIEEIYRDEFFTDYTYVYNERPLRTATIPYDLMGVLSYLVNEDFSVQETSNFLNNGKIKFDGIDGKFFFLNNVISRDLNILEIQNGSVKKLN